MTKLEQLYQNLNNARTRLEIREARKAIAEYKDLCPKVKFYFSTYVVVDGKVVEPCTGIVLSDDAESEEGKRYLDKWDCLTVPLAKYAEAVERLKRFGHIIWE